MEIIATPPSTRAVYVSPSLSTGFQSAPLQPLGQPTTTTFYTQQQQPLLSSPSLIQTSTLQPLGSTFTSQPVLTSAPTFSTQSVFTQPTQQFISSPSMVVSQRVGNYALIYTDLSGRRSRMLNIGAVNQTELQVLQSIVQWRNQRLQQLVNLQLLQNEPWAYASSNPQIPSGRIELGRVDVVDLNLDPVAASGYQWSRREVEGYFLAPFDIGTATAPAPESLGVSLQNLPVQVKYFLYPSYYPRS